MLKSRAAWKSFGIGSAVCLLIGGIWCAAVWDYPQFQEQVVFWQLGSRTSDRPGMGGPGSRSGTSSAGSLPGRFLPWRRSGWHIGVETDGRKRILLHFGEPRFCSSSASFPPSGTIICCRSIPRFSWFAGVALQRLLGPILLNRSRWVMLPATAVLMGVPLLFPWVDQPQVWGLVAASFLCGAIGFLLYARGSRSSFVVTAVGVIAMHGIYHHEFHQDGRADYRELLTFIKSVKQIVPHPQEVTIYESHPLIAYQLHQHQESPTVEELKERIPNG